MVINQKIFKSDYVRQLREDLKSGLALKNYFLEEFLPPENMLIETTLKIDSGNLELTVPLTGNPADVDFDNSIKIYESYRSLNETQASDSRLWTFLTHCTFRKYVMQRWKIGQSYDEIITDNSLVEKTIEQIISHWFTGGNDRSLRRNAIARLWWAAHLTVSPWDKDSEYFSDSDTNKIDPYKYTRILFSTQDVFQQVLERGIGRNSHILISMLDYIGNHPDLSRDQIRSMVKELNLTSSIRNISILNINEISNLIEKTISTT